MDISEKNLEDTIEQSLLSSAVVAPPDVPDLVLINPHHSTALQPAT